MLHLCAPTLSPWGSGGSCAVAPAAHRSPWPHRPGQAGKRGHLRLWCRRAQQAPRSQQASLTPLGFEPTQLALVELESTPLDHSGKVSGDLRSGVHVHPHVSRDVQGCARWIASGGTRTTHHAQQSGHAAAACSPGAAHGRPAAVCRARRCWSALAGCEQRERCATRRGTAFFGGDRLSVAK